MSIRAPEEINKCSTIELEQILDQLFEPCRTLTNFLIPKIQNHQSFSSYNEVLEYCRNNLMSLLNNYKECNYEIEKSELHKTLCKIVSAHPRLGVPKDKISSLSKDSQNEQKSLTEGDPNGELAQKLKLLNDKYEEAFPGLIFVVFVNGRSRDQIMKIMNERILNSTWINEVSIAFNEMVDIAFDRARKVNAKL